MITLEKTWRPLHEQTTGEITNGLNGWTQELVNARDNRDIVGMRQAVAFCNVYATERNRRFYSRGC